MDSKNTKPTSYNIPYHERTDVAPEKISYRVANKLIQQMEKDGHNVNLTAVMETVDPTTVPDESQDEFRALLGHEVSHDTILDATARIGSTATKAAALAERLSSMSLKQRIEDDGLDPEVAALLAPVVEIHFDTKTGTTLTDGEYEKRISSRQ
jgi:hypothetical protein